MAARSGPNAFDGTNLLVANKPCAECLFSQKRLVSARRKSELLRECYEQGTYFICHEATLAGRAVICHNFAKSSDGGGNVAIRFATHFNFIKYVEPGGPSEPSNHPRRSRQKRPASPVSPSPRAHPPIKTARQTPNRVRGSSAAANPIMPKRQIKLTKLTDPQFAFLCRLVKEPTTATESYGPARKLVDVGFATRAEGRYGALTHTVTDDGRAHHHAIFTADKKCSKCKTASWTCRTCGRKVCEHYCHAKILDGKTAICGRCKR
jgi:hypothetical protein